MNSTNDWIEAKANSAPVPAQVRSTLLRLAQDWPADEQTLVRLIEDFPLGEAALLHLISISSVCAARLIQQPDLLIWLGNEAVTGATRPRGQMLAELRRFTTEPIASSNFRALRLWKGREMLRIALREIAQAAPLEETTAELSQLAEICLAEVCQHWDQELRKRRGAPDTDFAILGLGKLGGRELNHSSDIDVIFLYGSEGQVSANLTNHEWFNRFAAKVVETFSATDSAGSLFRIDLRLRPEGSAGPLTRSLESMENYYAGFGETWERLALIKARSVGGSAELAYEFLRQHQPFIYPRSPTPDLLDEIATIKRRIERDVVGHEDLDRNVKLGTGGIREIEFITQALQLIHGARHAFLQDTSTLKVLPALARLDLLPGTDAKQLDAAYRFLRLVEHRLQIVAEQQTHTLPDEPEAFARLSRSIGFASPNEFKETLRLHRQAVRAAFERVISSAAQTPAAGLSPEIFSDPKGAQKALGELAQAPASFHVSARTRQVFRKLQPLLISELSSCSDPDAALNQLVRFIQAYGMRSLLFELLVLHPKLLQLLVRTLDGSRFAGDILIRHPQLLEEITRDEALVRPLSVADHLTRLRARKLTAAQIDGVRAYRQKHLLRIVIRDVTELADTPSIIRENSDLAEACLLCLAELLGAERELTIVALGKFGGREVGYGADLDVLFIGEDLRAAQTLLATAAQPSAEGPLGVLDPRLRPDGEKGPLVATLESVRSYYQNRAQLWEIQALTRARPITGPQQNEIETMAQEIWRNAGQRPDLSAQIDAMLARIRRDRGSGADELDYKTGVGGLIEAEFLVQALQMRAGIWNPEFEGALDALGAREIIDSADRKIVSTAYGFIRQCDSMLRRFEMKSVSSLPREPNEQQKIARRAGLQDAAELLARLNEARSNIHRIYEKLIAPATVPV